MAKIKLSKETKIILRFLKSLMVEVKIYERLCDAEKNLNAKIAAAKHPCLHKQTLEVVKGQKQLYQHRMDIYAQYMNPECLNSFNLKHVTWLLASGTRHTERRAMTILDFKIPKR